MFAEIASRRTARTPSYLSRAARSKRPAWRYGRFLQADPIGYAGGMNLYAYVANDPVNATDPMGTAHAALTGTRIRYAPLNPYFGGCNTCTGYSYAGASAGYEARTRSDFYDRSGNLIGQTYTAWQPIPNPGFGGADLFFAASPSRFGAIFGDSATGARQGVALTDKTGDIDTAWEDLDYLAGLNRVPQLGNRGYATGLPVGWVMLPIPHGFIVRHIQSGLQLRDVGGRIHIDIPPRARVGPHDFSIGGEVVHYGR